MIILILSIIAAVFSMLSFGAIMYWIIVWNKNISKGMEKSFTIIFKKTEQNNDMIKTLSKAIFKRL